MRMRRWRCLEPFLNAFLTLSVNMGVPAFSVLSYPFLFFSSMDGSWVAGGDDYA